MAIPVALITDIAEMLFKLAPRVFSTISEAKPLAEDLIAHARSKTTTPEERAALHAKIDELTADILGGP